MFEGQSDTRLRGINAVFYCLKELRRKSRDSVVTGILASKHQQARIPDTSSLHQFKNAPTFVDIYIAEEKVKSVALHLSGTSAGASGTVSHAL